MHPPVHLDRLSGLTRMRAPLGTALALAASLGACAPEGGGDPGGPPTDEGVEQAEVTDVGNWADQDTSGVGTHRISGDAVNVRGDVLSQIKFVADEGEQLVLTYRTQPFNGFTYYEGYFKAGGHQGQRGWVAGDFLAHAELVVCNGDDVSVRAGPTLGTVVGTVDRGDKAYVTTGKVRNTGSHRYFEVSAAGLNGFVATGFLCRSSSAQQVLDWHNAGRVTLWNQTFGQFDGADPLSNVRDAAAGRPAKTSCYGTAPCTSVHLKPGLLDGMAALAGSYGFSYFVTSIAGASHSATSLHYQGRAVDVGTVNGVVINGDGATARAFMNACSALGAIEVLGPSNDSGHQDHIHCAW
jgi:hypothetical protein